MRQQKGPQNNIEIFVLADQMSYLKDGSLFAEFISPHGCYFPNSDPLDGTYFSDGIAVQVQVENFVDAAMTPEVGWLVGWLVG